LTVLIQALQTALLKSTFLTLPTLLLISLVK